jgi:hypothetical protein
MTKKAVLLHQIAVADRELDHVRHSHKTKKTALLHQISVADRELDQARHAMDQAVANARRDQTITWQDIAHVLGITRQGAHARFHHLTDAQVNP